MTVGGSGVCRPARRGAPPGRVITRWCTRCRGPVAQQLAVVRQLFPQSTAADPVQRGQDVGHHGSHGGGVGPGQLPQLRDQLGAGDPGEAGNVVDWLFWIKRAALPADGVQRIDHMAAQADHPAFKNGKQADRPGADHGNIGLMAHA